MRERISLDILLPVYNKWLVIIMFVTNKTLLHEWDYLDDIHRVIFYIFWISDYKNNEYYLNNIVITRNNFYFTHNVDIE